MYRIGRSRTCRNHLCSWDRLDHSGRRVHFGIIFLLSRTNWTWVFKPILVWRAGEGLSKRLSLLGEVMVQKPYGPDLEVPGLLSRGLIHEMRRLEGEGFATANFEDRSLPLESPSHRDWMGPSPVNLRNAAAVAWATLSERANLASSTIHRPPHCCQGKLRRKWSSR